MIASWLLAGTIVVQAAGHGPAPGLPMCIGGSWRDRAQVVDILARYYNERLWWRAVTERHVIEVYRSIERATITVLITNAGRRSCVLADGESLELFSALPPTI